MSRYRGLTCWPLLVLVLSLNPAAAKDWENQREQVEGALFQFHLAEAEQLLENWDNPAMSGFYQFHIHFYQYLTSQDPKALASIRAEWDPILEVLESLEETHSDKFLLLSELHAKKGMVEFLDKNYLAGVWAIRSSRSYLKRQLKAQPQNPNALKMEGLFNCLFGVIPKKYRWITQTLGYRGNVQTGITQLEKAYKEGTLLRMEAQLLHYFSTKNLLNKAQAALGTLEQVRKSHPPSILLDYCQITGYLGIKQNEKALKILKLGPSYRQDPAVFYIPLWDYHLGRAYYYKAAYPQAKQMFTQFLAQHKGDLFRTDATFRLGMAYLLTEDYLGGKHYFGRLLESASSDLEEDEYAAYLAERFFQEKPSAALLTLFKSRNAYDGGYYPKALGLLEPLATHKGQLTQEELTQLYYLYGRIYHTQGKLPLAHEHYLLCISQPDQQATRWQQSYSSYYIGEIAKNQNKRELAESYYKKALSYNDYFYQASLENQCKVALQDL